MFLDRLLTPRRAWLAIALGTAALVAGSLVLTKLYSLHPCYLCVFQRLLFMLVAVFAAAAALSRTRRLALVAGVAVLACTVIGGAVAGHQVWLQAQPGAEFMCSGGDATTLERFVQWLGGLSPFLFGATGNCGSTEMVILGLSLAGWSLVGFSAVLLAGMWLLWRTWRQARQR